MENAMFLNTENITSMSFCSRC